MLANAFLYIATVSFTVLITLSSATPIPSPDLSASGFEVQDRIVDFVGTSVPDTAMQTVQTNDNIRGIEGSIQNAIADSVADSAGATVPDAVMGTVHTIDNTPGLIGNADQTLFGH